MKSNFLIADISWNPNKWKDLYINPKAGHKYAREYPGHESLNFKFDKKGIDTENEIFGFIQWKNRPVKFLDGGIIIFYSNNTDIKKGQIVGIYTNVEILNQRKETIWEGFKDNLLNVNIKADKELSMLFPVLLDANLYKQGNSKRITGQVGYSYYDLILAKKIIEDELLELYKKEDFKNEFEKLEKIYIDFSFTCANFIGI